MKWKNLKKGVSFFLFLVISLSVFSTASFAEKTKEKIKVGWFIQPGLQEIKEDGSYYGYNYEYLMNIAQYTNWEYEFVYAETFKESYDMLKNGEVDIMGSLIHTNERAKEIDFVRTSSGIISNYLFTKSDNSMLAYDFNMFNNMTVGCRDNQNAVDFISYAKQNNFNTKIVYYANTKEIEDAVISGEVTAGIITNYVPNQKTKIVARFTPSNFYFATTKGNKNVLDKLNDANDNIKLYNSYYEQELAEKYFPALKTEMHLTAEEISYIKSINNNGGLRVVYGENWFPLEYKNDKGNYDGVISNIYIKVSELTGLKFIFDSDYSFVENGLADIISTFNYNFKEANNKGYKLTNKVLSLPLVCLSQTNKNINTDYVVGTVDYFYNYNQIKELNTKNIKFYKNTEECLKALLNEEIDKAVINAYSADYHLKQTKYSFLDSIDLYSSNFDIAIAIRDDYDPMLNEIFNKAIGMISDADINGFLIDNTIGVQEINLKTIIEYMPVDVIVVACVLVFVIMIIFAVLFINRLRYSRKIQNILFKDDLTGLYSLKGFDNKVRRILNRSHSDKKFFISDFDINHFEEYNTINGFEAGDELLKNISKILYNFLKSKNKNDGICARVRADQFIVFAEAFSVEEVCNEIAEINQILKNSANSGSIVLSFGVYEILDKKLSMTTIRDRALIAKRIIKGNYEKFVSVYDENLHNHHLESIGLINRFEDALKQGELIAYFQPQHDMNTEKIIGAEALVRWIPKDGSKMIMPDRFIELLEKNGLIGKLDLYMFEQACKKLNDIKEKYGEFLIISVNISRVHLYDNEFVDKLTEIANIYKVPTYKIEIELTETAFLESRHDTTIIMDKLRSAGFLVAIDDFGSGFSSLNMLKDVTFDTIKIDREFLNNTSGTQKGETVIQNILSLAKNLDLNTVAEGVETKEQLDFLRDNGCKIAQGYYFSKPVDETNFDFLLNKQFNEEK